MDVDLNDLRIRRTDEERPPKRPRSPWAYLFFLLLAVSVGLFWWRERARPPTPGVPVVTELVRAEQAEAAGGPGAFTAAGWVKLPNYHPIYVTPLTEGRLEELLVIEGDVVRRGQVIARLYRPDYQAALAATEAALDVARANHEKLSAGYRVQEIEETRAELEQRAAEEKKARQDLERSRILQPRGAISLAELERDEAAAAAAGAALARVRERLKLVEEGFRREEILLAKAEMEQAKARCDLARLKLEHTEIEAPADGTVLERLASPGQWLAPGAGAVVSLYDPADLEAQIDVSQDHIAKVALGQIVEITTRAEPNRTQSARVVLIEPKADQVKNIVRVKVKFNSPEDGILYPDMVVQARFREPAAAAAAAEPARITIPAAAVIDDGGQRFVFVVEQGKARRREVQLGAIEKGRYPVLDGLSAGEQLVTGGAAGLTDGADVHSSS